MAPAYRSSAGDGSRSLASTGPINPQSTDQVAVNFNQPGEYKLSTASGGGTDAALATDHPIQPASLHIGAPRSASSNQLLQP